MPGDALCNTFDVVRAKHLHQPHLTSLSHASCEHIVSVGRVPDRKTERSVVRCAQGRRGRGKHSDTDVAEKEASWPESWSGLVSAVALHVDGVEHESSGDVAYASRVLSRAVSRSHDPAHPLK